jgi:CheY-like chemotaxis protein
MAATVLLVDDDESVALFLNRAIKKVGANVSLLHVPEGEQAIRYLSREGAYQDPSRYPTPSVVLLDINMPRVSGFEVLAWKQNQQALDTIPVIMWSSSDMPDDKERARKLGAQFYFTKPMDEEGLVPLVKALKAYCDGLAT